MPHLRSPQPPTDSTDSGAARPPGFDGSSAIRAQPDPVFGELASRWPGLGVCAPTDSLQVAPSRRAQAMMTAEAARECSLFIPTTPIYIFLKDVPHRMASRSKLKHYVSSAIRVGVDALACLKNSHRQNTPRVGRVFAVL